MDTNVIRASIAKLLGENAQRLKKAAPVMIAISLTGAVLAPIIQSGSFNLDSAVAFLSSLGVGLLKDIAKDLIKKSAAKKKGEEELRKEIEADLLRRWQGAGQEGTAFRADVSRLLKNSGAVDLALHAAPADLKDPMTRSLATLGEQFDEFHWVLDEIREALADVQRRQVEQLATQREQLELQREQLAKTNLLLKLQRDRQKKAAVAAEAAPEEAPADIACPYKGLAAFQPQDAEDFFGRETLTAELLARLAGTRFLAVIGPSGSGKSSLVRAGIIPALWNGEIPGSETWNAVILTPGQDPLEELSVRIALQSGISAASLLADLRKDPHALTLAIKQYHATLPEESQLVLVVDQFEELFTICKSEEARAAFIAALMDALHGDSRAILLLTMRADFYGSCAAYPALAAALAGNQLLVGAMSDEEMRRAIQAPAERVGLALEPGLVEMVLKDSSGEPGALPLVSHALLETWQRRRGNQLTVQGYLEAGGVNGAIAHTAEKVIDGLNDAQKVTAQRLFMQMVQIEDTAHPTGRRVSLEALASGEQGNAFVSVLKLLADARLIITSEQTAEVAHEAIFRAWPWLRKLIDENRESIFLQNQITDDAAEWEKHGRDVSYLYTGTRLAAAREKMDSLYLGQAARDFLATGIRVADQARRRAAAQRRWATVGLLAVALVMTGLAVWAGISARTAREQAAIAQAASTQAVAQQATAQAERARAEEQAQIALARQLAAQAQLMGTEQGDGLLLGTLMALESAQRRADVPAFTLLEQYLDLLGLPVTRISLEGGWVTAGAFSPDGRHIVVGLRDGSVHVFEAAAGTEVLQLIGHSGDISQISFSPDGARIVTASYDGTARVWNAATGAEVARMSHGGDSVYSAVFSSDGQTVVSGGYDGTARVWSAATGSEIARMTHDGHIRMAAFSPAGRYVVSVGSDSTTRVWEAGTGVEITRVAAGRYVYYAEFSPDGRLVVTNDSGGFASVWDIQTAAEVSRVFHEDGVGPVAFSPDGRYVVSAGNDRTVRVWDAYTGIEIARMTGHRKTPGFVAFSPDGRYVLTGSWDGIVRVWEANTGLEISRMGLPAGITEAAFSPDGQMVLSAAADGTVLVWIPRTGNNVARMQHANQVYSVAVSPDGKYVASGSEDLTARVWDIVTGTELARATHNAVVPTVAFSPDGRYVASGDWSGIIRVWDATSGNDLVQLTTGGGQVWSLAFSPDGRYLLSGTQDGLLQLWDVFSGAAVVSRQQDGIMSVAYSRDGKYIAVGSAEGLVHVLDAATLTEAWNTVEMSYSTQFSPDGRLVATGGFQGEVRVLNAATGAEIAHMTHGQSINSVAFSPDSAYLLSGSDDYSARIWNATTGEEVMRIDAVYSVTAAAFSPDGRTVVLGLANGDVLVRYWHLEDLVAEACRRVPRNFTRAEWLEYVGEEPYRATCPNLPEQP